MDKNRLLFIISKARVMALLVGFLFVGVVIEFLQTIKVISYLANGVSLLVLLAVTDLIVFFILRNVKKSRQISELHTPPQKTNIASERERELELTD
jgi:hypothetical protein